MDEINTFYGKKIENFSWWYGVVLWVLALIDVLLENIGDKFNLIITIKGTPIDLNFFVILLIMVVVAIFILKIYKNKVDNNYIKLFSDCMEIQTQQVNSSIDILGQNICHENTKIYYKDIEYIELKSLGFLKNLSFFRILGIANYVRYGNTMRDVYIKKKDGSEFTFPEILNWDCFKAELEDLWLKVLLTNSLTKRNSTTVKNLKS